MSRVPAGGARGGGWAYLSLISTLPGLSLSPRRAFALQFVAFEGAAVALSAWYGLWDALPVATVGIGVATAGSGLMVTLSDRVRSLDPPERYRVTLFDSGVDVLMGLVAFIALVSYLLASGRDPGSGLVVQYFGATLPVGAVAFGLIIGWDLSYRIGTAWWVSITGLWRSVRFRTAFDQAERRGYVRLDLLTIGFAGLQLLLVPFLRDDRLLALAVVGHVTAVVVVSCASITLLRWR